MELNRGGCLCREPEEGASTSVCAPNNKGLGSGSSGVKLKEEADLAAASVLVALLASSPALGLGSGAAAGEWELLMALRLAGVGAMLVECLAGALSTSATFWEVGGEAGLRVGGEAAGGPSVFREGSKLSEVW